MDPFVAISVATAVVTFVEFGAVVARRLEELSQRGGLPKAYREIRTRLPLISGIIARIQDTHQQLPWAATYELETIASDCFEQIKDLEKILDRVAVAEGDSKTRRLFKAIASLPEDSRVAKIAAQLKDNVQLLTALNVSSVERAVAASETKSETDGPPTYSEAAGVFLLPFERDMRFIARGGILEEIHDRFAKNQRVAIAGMGGVGKSQIAIEVAYRFKDACPTAHVFWVYGGSVARFYQGYKRIAQKLNLPSWDDPDVSILELVSTWFQSTNERFLLIVDNADDISLYWPEKCEHQSASEPPVNLTLYLPQSVQYNASLLITTRDSRIAQKLVPTNKPISLEPMSSRDAETLFISYADNKDPQTYKGLGELLQTLDNLPLAITQAARFIDQNSITVSEYLSALHDDQDVEEYLREELQDSRRDEQSINSVFRTWKVSFETISRQKPLAADLLSLLAVLDRQSVPRWLIKMPGVTTSIGILCSFHLITLRSGSNSLQLHRLVQKFMQCSLRRAGTLQKWKETALFCISQAFPTGIGPQDHAVCDDLTPHVEVVTRYEFQSVEARLQLAHLLCWAADFDVERGMLAQSLRRAKQSLDIFQELAMSDDPRLASATWMYGRLLYYCSTSEDENEKARCVLQNAYDISALGTISRAGSAYELAYLAFLKNDEAQCLAMSKASVDCWRSAGGDHDVRAVDEMDDYAYHLSMFGHTTEAIHCYERIVELTPRCDVPDAIKNVYTYRSLAGIAEAQGDFAMAELMYAKLIDTCAAVYNGEHVPLLCYRLLHAEQVLRQGRAAEARALSERMLRDAEGKSDWRLRLNCLETIAECHKAERVFADEACFRATCLELQSRYLGAAHEETIYAAETLARSLVRQAEPDYGQAEALFRRVHVSRKSSRGADHRTTIDVLEWIGVCVCELDRYGEAEQIFAEVAASNRSGSEAARWYRSQSNLCAALWNQRKWTPLELACRKALDAGTAYEAESRWMLDMALGKQGKGVEDIASRARGPQVEVRGLEDGGPKRVGKPRPPESDESFARSFGRIIHPRSWSI